MLLCQRMAVSPLALLLIALKAGRGISPVWLNAGCVFRGKGWAGQPRSLWGLYSCKMHVRGPGNGNIGK
jgi:hypothetical protein